MSTLLIVLAIILGVIGIIGSIVPGLPGPPLSWAGLLLAYLSHRLGGADMSFFTPLGMIPCSLLGAFLAELFQSDKSAGGALKSALGTFAGFLVGTGMKLIVTVTMTYYILF